MVGGKVLLTKLNIYEDGDQAHYLTPYSLGAALRRQGLLAG